MNVVYHRNLLPPGPIVPKSAQLATERPRFRCVQTIDDDLQILQFCNFDTVQQAEFSSLIPPGDLHVAQGGSRSLHVLALIEHTHGRPGLCSD
jgi:hypothetical protein